MGLLPANCRNVKPKTDTRFYYYPVDRKPGDPTTVGCWGEPHPGGCVPLGVAMKSITVTSS